MQKIEFQEQTERSGSKGSFKQKKVEILLFSVKYYMEGFHWVTFR